MANGRSEEGQGREGVKRLGYRKGKRQGRNY
jgi:hypothetical protein